MLLALSSERGVEARPEDGGRQLPSDSTIAGYWRVEPNDLVFNPMWAVGGGVAASTLAGAVSTAYRVYKPGSRVLPRFLHYFLRSSPVIDQYKLVVRGLTTFDRSVTRDDFDAMPVPVPPIAYQRAIVDYLDAETARIDALVAKKRRMMELNNERFTTMLTSIVTGDRLEGAPTETSSEWFPRLPAGWQIASVGRMTRVIMDGPHVSPTYVDDGVPFISVRNISKEGWDFSTAKYISDTDYRAFSRRVKPEVGDVLLTKGGNTGIARVVDLTFPFHVWVHIAILKPRMESLLGGYLAAVLNSNPGYEQSQLLTRGATNQDLVLGRIARIVIPLPPLDVQESLVRDVERYEAFTSTLRGRLERQVELLIEHRQALITAAVTGELDIPGVAA
jgi:type I restriction enzyme S subunit